MENDLCTEADRQRIINEALLRREYIRELIAHLRTSNCPRETCLEAAWALEQLISK